LARSESEVTLRALVLQLGALKAMQAHENNRLATALKAVCGNGNIQNHLNWLNAELKRLIKII
jgi:hypothetical protein